MNSFYEILGVERDASGREIRHAFLRLAHQHHPDLNRHDADADEQFKFVRRAYEVLRDPIRRAAYDDNPGLFPLAARYTSGSDESTIVTQPIHSTTNTRHSSDYQSHPGSDHQFHLNLRRKRPIGVGVLIAGVCVAMVTLSAYACVVVGRAHSPIASEHHRDPYAASAAPASEPSPVRVPESEDSHARPTQTGDQSATIDGERVAPVHSKDDANDDQIARAWLPGVGQDFQLDELQQQMRSDQEQLLILPRDESHTLLIPDIGTAEVILVPDEPLTLVLEDNQEQRLLLGPAGLEPTLQQLLDTPLPELSDNEAWLGSETTTESLVPMAILQQPTTGLPAFRALRRDSLSATGESLVRRLAAPPGKPVSSWSTFGSAGEHSSYPVMLPTAPPAAASSLPSQAAVGLPITGTFTPSIQPQSAEFPPVENKHQPYRPFNPLLPTHGLRSTTGHGF